MLQNPKSVWTAIFYEVNFISPYYYKLRLPKKDSSRNDKSDSERFYAYPSKEQKPYTNSVQHKHYWFHKILSKHTTQHDSNYW